MNNMNIFVFFYKSRTKMGLSKFVLRSCFFLVSVRCREHLPSATCFSPLLLSLLPRYSEPTEASGVPFSRQSFTCVELLLTLFV